MIYTKLFVGDEKMIKAVGKSPEEINIIFLDNCQMVITSKNSSLLDETFSSISTAIKEKESGR